jgi:hypothetical protein
MLPERVPHKVLSEPAGKAVKMLDDVPVVFLVEIKEDRLVFV